MIDIAHLCCPSCPPFHSMTYLDPIPFVLRSGGRADEGTNRGTTNRGKRRDTTVPSEIGGGVAPAITDVAANIPSSPAVDRRGRAFVSGTPPPRPWRSPKKLGSYYSFGAGVPFGLVLLKASDWGRRTGYSRLRRGCFSRSMIPGVQGPPYFRRVAPSVSFLLPSLREYWPCALSR